MIRLAMCFLKPGYVRFMFECLDTAGIPVGTGDKQLYRDSYDMMLMGGEL